MLIKVKLNQITDHTQLIEDVKTLSCPTKLQFRIILILLMIKLQFKKIKKIKIKKKKKD